MCDNYGEEPCPFCGGEYGGEGYVKKERADAYLAKQAEYHAAFKAALGDHLGSRTMTEKQTALYEACDAVVAYLCKLSEAPGDEADRLAMRLGNAADAMASEN